MLVQKLADEVFLLLDFVDLLFLLFLGLFFFLLLFEFNFLEGIQRFFNFPLYFLVFDVVGITEEVVLLLFFSSLQGLVGFLDLRNNIFSVKPTLGDAATHFRFNTNYLG